MALTRTLQNIADVLHAEVCSTGAVDLEECHRQSTIQSFRLKTSWPTLLLRFDRVPCNGMTVNERLFPLFRRGLVDVCKCCDYVILWQRNDDPSSPLYVLLTELKSGNTNGAQTQIKNARVLVDYLLEMVRMHRGGTVDPDNVEYRGLTFTPSARPQAGNPRHGPAYFRSTSMPDLLILTIQPCNNFPVDWFCTGRIREWSGGGR